MIDEDVFFTADAALIDRIGRELVGKQETGLLELIKNSYDADATAVKVVISAGGLVIEDNGVGMNREELITGFLRLANDTKIRNPISQRYHRRRAGRKGIGRFATQRLGSGLVLRTWKSADQDGVELMVDWRTFEQGLALDEIPLRLRQVARRCPGTEINIVRLRDSWTDAQVSRCWRGVLSLQQPFPVAPVEDRPQQDPGFQVEFYRSGEQFSDQELVANLETEILDHMHAVVEFQVDHQGHAQWRLTQNKFGPDGEWAPINHANRDEACPAPYENLCNAWMKAYYAILDPTEFSGMVYSRVRDLLRSSGGVRLYRNGFRVVPFGDPEDDWLRLDETYSKRSELFPIANRNWFGIVEVRDPEGVQFEEPTSREGLIQTQAFDELRNLASSVLITAAQKVAEHRNRKVRAGGGEQEPTDFYLQRVRQAAKRARERETSESRERPEGEASSVSETAELLDEAEEIIEEVRAQFADEASMLRLLATIGLAAAEFSHETGMTFQAVKLDFGRVFEAALQSQEDDDEFCKLVVRARDMIERLDALTAYLNSAASARAVRELVPISVSRSVEEFARGMGALAAQSGVEVLTSAPTFDGLYTQPMHQAEVASILLNFYSNAIKAMKRRGANRRILAKGYRDKEEIVLQFSDTGDGIADENRERVFDLFYTTRVAASSSAGEEEESSGAGLGLWIVRQIVQRVKGTVEVVGAQEGYSTTFEVRVPAGDEIR